MNRIEHVFNPYEARMGTGTDRDLEVQSLLVNLERIAQSSPKKIFCYNKNWFYNEDTQTGDNWLIIKEMLEALEIPIQDREFELFGFYSIKLPGDLILQNFNFLKNVLPAPEETEFEIQKINPSILQSLGRKITYFKFGFSTLEIATNIILVLSDDETEDLNNRLYEGKTVWEIICLYPFRQPIKYIVVHSISKCLNPRGRIETKYSAQLNLLPGGFEDE